METVTTILGFALLAMPLLSLCPFTLRNGWQSWSLYLPLIASCVYAAYEFSIPVHVNIRIDLAFMYPILLFVWLNGAAKTCLMLLLRFKDPIGRYKERPLQLVMETPIAVGCWFWFKSIWNP
jgi:hypothetical protein